MAQVDIAVPVLPARDLQETIQFYERLGFKNAYRHSVLAEYVVLRLGVLELQFFEWPKLDTSGSFTGCYLRVADVDALYQAFANARLPARGIPSMGGIESRPWGMREFHLIDCNGNLLRAGEYIKKPRAGSQRR